MSDTPTSPSTLDATASNIAKPEPVTIDGYSVNERTGQSIPILDAFSDSAINGGYDALRLAKSDSITIRQTAQTICAIAAPRAREVAEHLISDAGAIASLAWVPGGSLESRRNAKALIKATLRAERVARQGKRY